MKIVIQCAGSKHADAGSFFLKDSRKVIFVASPSAEPPPKDSVYARPDDMAEDSRETWREKILRYNRTEAGTNPLNLLPAYKLYTNKAYQQLVDKFGKDKVFILSAGWGLIPAYFLTPAYDITFSVSGALLNRRKPKDHYKDFCLMEDDGEEVVFLGGKSYLPLFQTLTEKMPGQKTVFYNSQVAPRQLSSSVMAIRFETSTRTNWHYECARALAEGRITKIMG